MNGKNMPLTLIVRELNIPNTRKDVTQLANIKWLSRNLMLFRGSPYYTVLALKLKGILSINGM